MLNAKEVPLSTGTPRLKELRPFLCQLAPHGLGCSRLKGQTSPRENRPGAWYRARPGSAERLL